MIPLGNATRGILGGSPNTLLHNYATVDQAADASVLFSESYCVQADCADTKDVSAQLATNDVFVSGDCFEVVGSFDPCETVQASEDINVYKGSLIEIPFKLVNSCGIVEEITGEVRFVIKGDDGIGLAKTSDNPGIEILDQVEFTGQATITVTSAETDTMAQGTYLYEIYIDVSGEFFRVAFGVFDVL